MKQREVDTGALAREARGLMKGSKRAVLLPILIVAALIFGWTLSTDPTVEPDLRTVSLLNIVLGVLGTLTAPGLTAIGLRRAAGLEVSLADYMGHAFPGHNDRPHLP